MKRRVFRSGSVQPLYHASDYFDWMYQFAEKLIEHGDAYVDSQSAEELRATRGSLTEHGLESPHRNRSVAENLQLFREMRDGKHADGAHVDVSGTTKGKGTAGVMKRHGFHGLGAGHGVQRKHRSPGSIGGCATPGRVFKGMKMAGRMGHAQQTTQSLIVHKVDTERGLLLIRGAIPGPKGGLVLVRSAAKGA